MSQTQLGTGPPATDVIGRYRIEELLGGGGCGVVYAGRHEILGKPVAIKMLRPELANDSESAQRFFREARIAATLHHENIVDITDFGDEGTEAPYLVMELLRGRSLMSVVRDAGALPWPRVISILIQLARALGCAHGLGVIHRDLKPHNVMLEESSGRYDRVKLCDFGLSRLCSGEDRITATGEFVGTPAYTAPEQILGGVLDARCDLYALGVTGFEMLTGSLPYAATTPIALVAEILGEQRRTLRGRVADDVPDELVALIERCLEREPDARPQTALEIETALLAITSRPIPAVVDLVGHVIGSYRVISTLGAGGSGSVWLAEHSVIGTKVAIKVLRPEIATMPGVAERFVNEARATGLIQSPYIARYLDIGRLPSGQPYAILEYLDGETLFDRIASQIRLPIGEALTILRQIASALVQVHAAGITHRDIKPENVFLTTSEHGATAKVLDFGIAKMADPNGPQTRAGFFMGTVAYCPPEQILGDSAGPAADVYALGATMFHVLTGHTPFTGDSIEIATAKTNSAAPTVLSARPDAPGHLAALVDEMLALHPADRPTMAEVLERLVASAPKTLAVPERRPRWPFVVGAIAIVATLVMLWPASAPPPITVPPPIAKPQPRVVAPTLTITPLPDPPPPAAKPKPVIRKRAPKVEHTGSDVIIADPFGGNR